MENKNFIENEKIHSYIKEIRLLKEEIKCLEEREKKIKYEIAKIIGESDAICNKEGTVIATYKYSNRMTFDMNNFKKDAPSLYETYCKPTLTRIFLLKE